MNPRFAIALFLAGLLSLGGIVVGLLGRSADEPEAAGRQFEGSVLPPGVRAPDFALQNQDGETIRTSDLRGRPAVVTFMYTNCEDTCPPQAQQIKGAMDELGHDVPAIAVAVDPPDDTARSARRFLIENRMTGRLDFVLGRRDELEPVWRGFHTRGKTATADHQGRITLLDARGHQRVSFPIDQATPTRIAHDLRLLEAETERG